MKDIAPLIFVERTNFHEAWVIVLRNILGQGVQVILVDNRGEKNVIDSSQTIVFSGYALEQIRAGETHKDYPYLSTPTYCKEWTHGYLAKYQDLPKKNKPVYLAFERLAGYPASEGLAVDQLIFMRDSLKRQMDEGIVKNNCQAITWNPETDLESEASPFLQRIWARVYKEGKIDAHFYWRATDAYNHFQSRLICILNMFDREVVKPNSCRMVRAVCHYDSLYVNRCDASSAEAVGFPVTDPRLNYR